MKITIKCTAAEQTQFKQNIKINADDTGIIYIQQFDYSEDITSGQQFLSLIEWRIEDGERH